MRANKHLPKPVHSPARRNQRGVALVTALLLLLLLTGLSIIMVLSTSSDLLTNGYYRGFRGAFYASDSGLNVVRQDLANQILLQQNKAFSTAQQALLNPANAANAVQTYIQNTYGKNFQAVSGTGQGKASGSWPESFKVANVSFGVDPTTNQPNWTCTLIGGSPTGTCANPLW